MQVTLERQQHARAAEKASQLGVSLAEYIRGLVAADLDRDEAVDGDISEIFGIGDSGGADVATHKDAYLAGALTEEHVPAQRAG